MKLLFIGDIVGKPGRRVLKELLPEYRRRQKIDAVIANAENAAAGSGITKKLAKEIFDSGVDIMTSGDHIWRRKQVYELFNETDRLLRPTNYPDGAPGSGSTVVELPNIGKIGVINLIGRVFMEPLDCPFAAAEKEVEKLRRSTPVIVVDMHAEATSEKVAMGWYLDGMVSAVLGTHTHIQTADEKILPQGTAYITDCGMTGPYDSVIGRDKDSILQRFLTQRPTRFHMAEEGEEMHGVVIEIEEETGKAFSIKRVQEAL